LGESYLASQLSQILAKTVFSGRLRITPRRVQQVAQEVAVSFTHFVGDVEQGGVQTYGQQLAQEGLGPRSVLALAETLRRVCLDGGNPGGELFPAAERYTFALLEGYMTGREAYLLEEQERARRALERARQRDRSE